MIVETTFANMRLKYDNLLSRGERAMLKRCRSVEDMLMEGAFWRIYPSDSKRSSRDSSRLAAVALCFPAAQQTRHSSRFTLGRHLRAGLCPGDKELLQRSTRFRQLLAARDRGELVHHLRRLLMLIEIPVEWGVIGNNIYYWGDWVRSHWAQDYYAPITEKNHE